MAPIQLGIVRENLLNDPEENLIRTIPGVTSPVNGVTLRAGSPFSVIKNIIKTKFNNDKNDFD